MANGRQRKRDNLLAKKAAEAGLAGLTPQALTSIISDDDNDLDNVSFSTTDGATTTIKNNRNKDTKPRKRGFAPLGESSGAFSGSNLGGRKGYKPGNGNTLMSDGSTTRSNLGGRKGYMPGNGNMVSDGPNGRKAINPMDDELMLSNGPMGRGSVAPMDDELMLSNGPMSRGSVAPMDDELMLSNGPMSRGSRKNKQAKALTDFIGEDLSLTSNRFVTVAMDSAEDQAYGNDSDVISEEINDDGTVTYELAPSNMGNPEVTTTASTEAQLEPGMYDGVEPGKETALTPTLDNKGYSFDSEGNVIAEQPLFGRNTAEENATAAITMEEQLKEQALLRQLQADTEEAQSDNNIDLVQSQADRIAEQNGDLIGFAEGPTSRSSRGDPRLAEIDAINNGTVESLDSAELTDGEDNTVSSGTTYPNIHENEPGTTPPEVVAKEAENAEKDIQAAQAGNPHLDGIVGDAKTEVETLKEEVETGVTTPEVAADKIKNSLGQLGELLGIDGKDLIRGLFRYAGARVFGMSGNEAGRFMYEGLMADEAAEAKVEAAKLENMGLGSGATAQQKNLKAYKEEIQRIDNDTSLSDEEKVAAKKTANEVFGVNKPTSMGRPVNIKGIRSDGSEEIVVGRRNDNNSYDVFMDDQWVPIEMSGLSDVQVTSRGAEQAFERGVADPRNDVGIDNATSVSPSGVPTFKHKNQFESDNYQMAKRAVDNYPIVDAMMKDPEMRKHITSAMGGLQTYAAGNANARITAASINLAIGDSIPQKYRSATQAWLQALLRADTGAAYSETEIMDYIATNIPQVGDKDDTVAFKLAQMKTTTETMAANAGQGAKYLLGRLDGSIEPPESVKELQRIGLGTKEESDDGSGRSSELQSALDQY